MAKVDERLFLIVVVTAVFVSVMAGSMVSIVIPAVRSQFQASEVEVGWIVTAYLLVFAIGVPLYGRISDFIGLRPLFIGGLLLFAAGSVVCAVAPNLPLLILGRVVQSAGDAAIPALAGVAVAKVLPPGRRGVALGFVVSAVGAGSAIGPIIGGAAEQFVGWRALFVGTFVLALLLIPGALRVLPSEASGARSFDLAGGLLLGLSVSSFLFGMTQAQTAGFGAPLAWGSFIVTILAGIGFGWRISTAADPFVSPQLFKNRPYVAATLIGFFTMFVNVSAIVFVPLLLIEVNGLSPAIAAVVLTPGALALALVSPRAGRLSDRLGARPLLIAGLVAMGISLLFLSTFAAGATPVAVSIGILGLSLGVALVNPATNNAAAGALADAEIGVGMGIFQGAFFLGGALGPVMTGIFLTARRATGGAAFNPFYTHNVAPFSDLFLAITVVLLFAFLAFFGMRRQPA